MATAMLNDAQKRKLLEIWDDYADRSKTFVNAQDCSDEELDKQRLKVIPEVKKSISAYLAGKMTLEQFKPEVDGINKRNRLWGFKGMNGQMFFNMLYNSSSGASQLGKLNTVLKQCIPLPKDIGEAKSKIGTLVEFSNGLADQVPDKRQAPRTGSCLFFISYFWQIQDHEQYPIYYRSMVTVLADSSLWNPSGEYPKDYADFFAFNHEAIGLLSAKYGKPVSLWGIEHACWIWGLEEESKSKTAKTGKAEIGGLPSGYIPPVVSVLPLLAKNDPSIITACQKTGILPEKAFEERLAVFFRMAGFKVESKGQGHGRVADGVAICQEYRYALVYDAKVRTEGYSIGTDDRAIKEYILHETEPLRKQGIQKVYFAVISSSFNGDFDDAIRTLKIDTGVAEVLFIEASALVVLLEEKLRNPEFDLGAKGVQGILTQSGVIKEADMRELLGI